MFINKSHHKIHVIDVISHQNTNVKGATTNGPLWQNLKMAHLSSLLDMS